MQTAILIIHVAVSIILMGMVLIQSGKGASVGAAFGSGGAQTVFGARGPATFFQKMTIVLAATFLFTSITLARMARIGGEPSVIEKVAAPVEAPVTPETPAAPAANSPDAAAPAEPAPVETPAQ